MPRVTVAILAYDRPEFLGTAIESVLAQTYTDFKLIIYDNCSTKDLKSVVDRFDDTRIIYHRNEKNIGMFGNAAQAVDLCDTEFLAILHDDDKYLPWAIERLVEIMDKHPEVGFASTVSGHVIMGSGDIDRHRNRTNGFLYKGKELAEMTAREDRYLSFTGMITRLSDLRSRSMNFRCDAGPAGDILFNLEASCRGVVSFGLDAPLVEYRLHPGQATNTEKAEAWHHTMKRICDYAVSHSLSRQAIDALKTRGARWSLGAYARALTDEGALSIDKFKARRDKIDKDLDMQMTDEEFYDCVSVGILGRIITAVGRREASISEYHRRIAELKEIGISVPLKRRLKWSLKYIVLQRWLGRR